MDELILRVVKEDGVDMILSLGAGLDTRPYRLPLPPALRWIEGDFPAVLTYKATKLAAVQPGCVLESVSLDVTDSAALQALLQRSGTAAKQVLVLTEGLLAYLSPQQVAALASELYVQAPFRWWLLDLASPSALRLIQKSLGESSAACGVRMLFAPAEGTKFFQQYGWKPVEVRSFVEEGQRLKRLAFPEELLTKLSREQWELLRTLSAVVLLTRADLKSRL